ncbi:hypothetical protein WMF37_12075 [Sorangium sp. So ce291]|uniref:hypothetical protein n=1 Tax=Sorangium sp. So ce291 TaxID=3133294 RepID=UPI003F6167E9
MSLETNNVRAASARARGVDLEGVAGRGLPGAGRAAGWAAALELPRSASCRAPGRLGRPDGAPGPPERQTL